MYETAGCLYHHIDCHCHYHYHDGNDDDNCTEMFLQVVLTIRDPTLHYLIISSYCRSTVC